MRVLSRQDKVCTQIRVHKASPEDISYIGTKNNFMEICDGDLFCKSSFEQNKSFTD